MPSEFERRAIQRLVDKATGMGVDVPREVKAILCGEHGNTGALLWVKANPDAAERFGCCAGNDMFGPEECACWRPVFDVDQADPIPPTSPADIHVRDGLCGDCAFRKGSPERAHQFEEEALFSLADEGTPFYCHDGMRRPVRWDHPDGRTVPGDPADWQPPMVAGLPYRINGRPGLLCAGWAARVGAAERGRSR